MSAILFQRCDGKPAGCPLDLPRTRRRLSALVRKHADHARPYIVSVHRRREMLAVTDVSVRLRKTWAKTTIGPRDTVIITYLPRGGGGSSGGSSAGKGASIGLLVAAVALVALGQFWAIGAINGALGLAAASSVGGTIWAGVTAAAIAGGTYLTSKATQAKANKTDDRPVYGVSGGGNLPRSGDRIPVIYGRCWTTPDLSQPDYTTYVGDDSQTLYKRLTIGCGRYALKTIRVAGIVMWTATGGLTPPFTGSEIELINPGATSSLVPGQVASVTAVGSNQLPKVEDFPDYAGPFEFGASAPEQQTIQLDYSLPSGCSCVFKGGKYDGKQFPTSWGVVFEAAPCDEDGEPTGPFFVIHSNSGNTLTTRPMRFTQFATLPAPGHYTFRARNTGAADEIEAFGGTVTVTNTVVWEGLRAHIPQAAVRPGITELAMKIHAGPELSVTSFGDVEVEVSRYLPTWTGSSWVEFETDKAAWAALDILRNTEHGAGIADSGIDLERFRHYATAVGPFDTFSGVLRGPVSVYEALSSVLGAMRASPLRLGKAWTMVRDEPKVVRKHVISRRRILKDSTGLDFNLDLSDGSADVIVEWYTGGDPKRRREHRVTFGTATQTPKRMQAFGAVSAEHAIHIATWAAAVGYYRRQRRSFGMEYAGKMLLPNDAALIDAWFFDLIDTAGILDAEIDRDAERFAMTIDKEIELPEAPFAYLRGRDGLEWGPVGVTRDGERLLLNAEDVAQAESLTDLALEDVLNTATQSFSDIVIGELETLQDQWLIRSLQFDGDNRVNVEAVYDAPEVWTALAEPIVPPPPPPSSGLENEASAAVSYVRAEAVQQTSSVYMKWAVGRSRGAAQYQIIISYDDWATSEAVYLGPSSSGTHPLREFDGTIRIRARGITAAGTVSVWVENAFSSRKAVLDLSNALKGSLAIQAFVDSLQPPHLVDELPDLFDYDGSKVVALIVPGEKPRLYYLSADGTEWQKQAAEDYIANTITSIAIQAGAIVAEHIGANQVLAEHINVVSLEAVSAVLGNVVVDGDLVVNGTLSTGKIAASAVTQLGFSSGTGTSTSIGVNVPSSATGVVVIGSYNGGDLVSSSSNGSVILKRDGVTIFSTTVAALLMSPSDEGSLATFKLAQTTAPWGDTPSPGSHTYSVELAASSGAAGVSITVLAGKR